MDKALKSEFEAFMAGFLYANHWIGHEEWKLLGVFDRLGRSNSREFLATRYGVSKIGGQSNALMDRLREVFVKERALATVESLSKEIGDIFVKLDMTARGNPEDFDHELKEAKRALRSLFE